MEAANQYLTCLKKCVLAHSFWRIWSFWKTYQLNFLRIYSRAEWCRVLNRRLELLGAAVLAVSPCQHEAPGKATIVAWFALRVHEWDPGHLRSGLPSHLISKISDKIKGISNIFSGKRRANPCKFLTFFVFHFRRWNHGIPNFFSQPFSDPR